MEKITSSISNLQGYRNTLTVALGMMDSDDQRGYRSNRQEHREIAATVPSLRPFCKKKKAKTEQSTNTNVQPLSARTNEHREPVIVPPPPPGVQTWREEEGMAELEPNQSQARKRARSRSAPRSPGRRSVTPPRRRFREKSKSPETMDSPLKSPSIQIDYSSGAE